MRLHFIRSHVLSTTLVLFFLFGFLNGCKKEDRPANPQLSETEEELSKSKRWKKKHNEESADVLYTWYNFIASQQRSTSPQPVTLAQLRAFGYIGVGLFEAVQPGIKGGSSFAPKLYQMPAMPKPDKSKDYLWSASANAAMVTMFKLFLVDLSVVNKEAIDAQAATIRSQLRAKAPEDVIARSEAFGKAVATAIYNWSATDNFTLSSQGYTPLDKPWAWVPTPPGFSAPVGANLQYSRPFLKYSLKAIAPPPPIPFSKYRNSEFYMAAKEVYDLGGQTTVSPQNRATAGWWADIGGPNMGLPAPYHVLSIVTGVLQSQESGLWKAAEVYAKTGIALKDGPIITFRSKYYYNLLRPITYIQRYIDPSWLSVLPNPPYPDYTSGIMGFYAPAIEVLINEFGDIPVTDNAYTWRGLPERNFASLSALRKEVAYSRVYAGIHFRFTQDVSIQEGIKLGDAIDKVRVVGPEYR